MAEEGIIVHKGCLAISKRQVLKVKDTVSTRWLFS